MNSKRPAVHMTLRLVAVLGVVVLAALVIRSSPGWYWGWRADNPVRRGAALAAREGCISCHAPLGREETANPGSRWGTVPSFYRGNTMMYVRSADQVATFIRFGNPDGTPRTQRPSRHADDTAPRPPFMMPAFGDRLSEGEIRDLAAFVLAADGYRVPAEGAVADGRELATRFGCEGCHGMAGSGGVPNPRSFTGAVPGWVAADFAHLVSDEREFSEWVLAGRSERWRRHRLASFFLDRANLQMPAFEGVLSSNDVADLWAYVRWLRAPATDEEEDLDRSRGAG